MRITLAIVIFLNSISLSAAVQNIHELEKNLIDEIKTYEQLNINFHKICFDKSGEFRRDTIITSEDGNIDCNEQVVALREHFVQLNAKISSFEVDDVNCRENNAKSVNGVIGKLALANSDIVSEAASCKEKGESDSECMGAIACNAFTSFVPVGMVAGLATKGILNIAKKLYSSQGKDITKSSAYEKLKECSSVETSCISQVMRGIFDSVFTTMEGLWTLLGWAKDGVVWVGKKAWKKSKDGFYYMKDSIWSMFGEVEDKSSEKLMLMQQMEDNALDKFMADPFGSIAKFSKLMFDSIKQSARNHYGCEEWSGAPHISECLQPMSNWDCGTCRQKMNVWCGVAGFTGGELLTAFLTGGLVNVAKAGLMTSVKVGQVATKQIGSLISQFPKVDKVLSTAANALKTSASTLVKPIVVLSNLTKDLWIKIATSDLTQKTLDLGSKVAENIGTKAEKVKKTMPYKALAICTKGTCYPLTEYLRLTGKAFMQGYSQTGKVLGGAENLLLSARLNNVSTPSDELLVKFFKEKNISKENQQYYRVSENADGQKFVEEDIVKLRGKDLSLPNRLENDAGAIDGLSETAKILTKEIDSVDDAMVLIQDAASNIHKKWLQRNSWAQNDPSYPLDFEKLNPDLQQANIDILKVVFSRNLTDASVKENRLLLEAIEKLEISIAKGDDLTLLREITGRPKAKETEKLREVIIKLESDNEITGVADEMHALWQKNTTHKERFKPVGMDDATKPKADLEAFFKENNIPEELRRYYRVTKNDEGIRVIEEDIKHIPNRYLSPKNAGENNKGAQAALSETAHISKIQISNVEEAKLVLQQAMENIHQSWLVRNSWAKDDPTYSPAWKNLTPEMQLADLDPLKIAINRNFDGQSESLNYYRQAIEQLERSTELKLGTGVFIGELINISGLNRELELLIDVDTNLKKILLSNKGLANSLLKTKKSQDLFLNFLKSADDIEKSNIFKIIEKLSTLEKSKLKPWIPKLQQAMKRACG